MNELIQEGQNALNIMLSSGRSSKLLWTNQTPPRLRRNRNCWFQGYNLSGFSFSNSLRGPRGAGVLVGTERRHILLAAHYGTTVGTEFWFADPRGTAEKRTVVSVKTHPYYRKRGICCDLQVARLDAPTSNRIQPLPVLPTHLFDSFPVDDYTGRNVLTGLPLFATDQEEKLLLLEGSTYHRYNTSWLHPDTGYETADVYFSPAHSLGPDAANVTETIISGDSGSPVVALWQGRLCLVTVFTTSYAGTSISWEFDMLRELGVEDLAWG